MAILAEASLNERIRLDIMGELRRYDGPGHDHVTIDVEHGIVTLTGHVNTFGKQFVAEQAALHASGVRAVADDLDVKTGGQALWQDPQIAEAVADLLEEDAAIPPESRPKVSVRNGTVVLRGSVDWPIQRRAAEVDTRLAPGVRHVVNLIRVEHSELEQCCCQNGVGSD